MGFDNTEDDLLTNEFFIIDSNNLELINSRMYGYSIAENGILNNENLDNDSELTLNGAYIYIKKDNDTVTISQDYIGSYGLYLFKKDDFFAISNSFVMIVEYLKNNHSISLNYDNAHSLLSLGLCAVSYTETLVNEIKMLPRDNIVKINIKTKELSVEVRDFEENTISIDSEEGIAILDKWFYKWTNLLSLLDTNNQKMELSLRGTIESRILLILSVASKINMNNIFLNLIKGSEKERLKFFENASEIGEEFGFKVKKERNMKTKHFADIKTPMNISFFSKLGFHKQMFYHIDYPLSPLFIISDNGANCIGSHEFISSEEFIENKFNIAKHYSFELANSLKSSIKRSLTEVKNRYGIKDADSNKLVELFYKETECRNHFGKWSVENYLSNRISLNPLLDNELLKLKYNTNDCEDNKLLMAVIFTRFVPKLLLFGLNGSEDTINTKTIDYAKEINKRYPFKNRGNENLSKVKLINSLEYEENLNENELDSLLNNKQNFETSDIDAFIENVFFTNYFKNTFQRYFSPVTYDHIASTVKKRTYMPLEDVYGAIPILKIMDHSGYDDSLLNQTYFNWLSHFLNEREYDDIGIKTLFYNKLLKYVTARIDIKNFGTEENNLTIMECSDLSSEIFAAPWLNDDEGVGWVINSRKGNIDLKIKCINDGQLQILLRGIDFRDRNHVRVPVFIDYTNLTINGNCIFDSRISVHHDNSYKYLKKDVKDGEIFDIHIEWEPFDYQGIYNL